MKARKVRGFGVGVMAWGKRHVSTLIVAAMNVALAAAPALAGSGIAKVDDTINKVQMGLYGVGVSTVAIALMWAGYKVAFQHAHVTDVARPVGGGLIVGSAAAIAGFLVA